MATYREKVFEIERMTKKFIDKSTDSLRSAEGAFEFLMKLRQDKQQSEIIKQVLHARIWFSMLIFGTAHGKVERYSCAVWTRS